MKTTRYILFAFFVIVQLSIVNYQLSTARADDYIDDIYYTPQKAVKKKNAKGEVTPTYDKKVKEIVFIEDTTSIQTNDTIVRAIIRE